MLIAFVVLCAAGDLILATVYNEAFHIKRAFPEARVGPSHRFSPVFSAWDFVSIIVPGDYVSPIDHATVTVRASSEPVDVAKLLRFRVGSIHIDDSEIANSGLLLRGHEPNIPIRISNPTFLGASPDELKILEKRKVYDEFSGTEVYWFGNV